MAIATAPVATHCRLCHCKLNPLVDRDDLARGLCGDCRKHPDARRLTTAPASAKPAKTPVPRAFTVADKALIRQVNGYMAPAQLLEVLNERLLADAGGTVAPYTLEQLHAEIRAIPTTSEASDWAGLRKVLAHARADGLLARITAQTIDDFAVVFSLSTAQVLRLKDLVLGAQEARR